MGEALDSVGLERGHVVVAAPDGRWADAFAELAERLNQAFAPHPRVFEHVGSTAVPGLAAKPIIDVAVALVDDLDLESCKAALVSAGFEFRGDQGGEGGLLFVLGPPVRRLAHIHVVAGGGRQWRDYLAFRDELRRDQRTLRDYAELKRALARDHPRDREAYTSAKNDFIQQVLRSSRDGTT